MEPSPRYGYVGPVSDLRDALADEPDNEHLLEESDVEPPLVVESDSPSRQDTDVDDGEAF